MKKIVLDINELKTLYESGLHIEKIALHFNCSRPIINRYIKENNFIKRKRAKKSFQKRFKYNFNQDYFKQIDTPDKAYFLGLLYADGCNTRYGLSIGLQESDKNILELLKNYINYTGSIFIKPQKNYKNMAVLDIKSIELSNQLSNLGCIPAKSLTLKFPTEEQVPTHLIHHFMRGYFDGDGCLGHYKKGCVFEVLGTYSFVEEFQKILIKKCGLNKVRLFQTKNRITTNLSYAGTLQVIKIRDYLYRDCGDLYLKRKKEKFDSVRKFEFQNTKKCNFCDRFCSYNGVCSKHYQQIRTHGRVIN